MSFTIEICIHEQADEIIRLVNEVYRTEVGWTTEATFLKGVRLDLEEFNKIFETSTILICLEEGDIIGCVSIRIENNIGFIGLLSVAARKQSCGIGSVLLAEAERFAIKNGCNKSEICVLDCRDALIAFYKRKRYNFTGRTEIYTSKLSKPKIPGLRFGFFEKALLLDE